MASHKDLADPYSIYWPKLKPPFLEMSSPNHLNLLLLSTRLCWLKPCFFFLNFLFYIGVESFNNVVIFSGGQEGTEPYIYMYPFSPKLPSHPGCHITLSTVSCAI